MASAFQSTVQSKSEDPTSAINSQSLVRQGKKIASKGSSSFAIKALRKSATLGGKALGILFGSPAVIASDLLLSAKKAGTDKYGRAVDTQKGFLSAQEDTATADYFAQYGSFPENVDFDARNPQAIFDRIKKQTHAQVMAEVLRNQTPFQRARGLNKQPTPEELARQAWGRKLVSPQVVQGE